jgi:predicted nucleic acid-binding protein
MEHKQITRDEYFDACSQLIEFLQDDYIQLDDTLKISPVNLREAENVARQYGLDLSDALQIITVKAKAHGSKTVLITADRALADAGTEQGLDMRLF